MKKLLFILTVVLAGQFTGLSQYWDKAFTSDLLILDEYVKRQDRGINFDDTDSYSGTPYNNASYLPGKIFKEDKLLAEGVALRYNAIADEMEVKENMSTSDDEAKVLTKSSDIYVKILGKIFVFVPYQGGIEEGGYFEVVFEGSQIDFYKKLEKDFDEAKKATSTITRDTPARFTDEPVYFLVTKTGKFYEFPKSRKRKLKVFGKKEKEIKSYVKEKRLDLNKEKDLLRAIRHFDQLEITN